MKKLVLTLLITCICSISLSYSQENTSVQATIQAYKAELNLQLELYKITVDKKDTQVVQDSLLTKDLNEVFNSLIFTNTDLISNASAFGFTRNGDNTTISLSNNFKIKDSRSVKQSYLSVGVNANGMGSVFGLYSEDAWNSAVGLNVGYKIKIFRATKYIDTSKSKLNRHKKLSRINAFNILLHPEKFNDTFIKRLKGLKASIENNTEISQIKKTENYMTVIAVFPEIKKLIESKDYVTAYTVLEKEKKTIDAFRNLKSDPKKITAYVKKQLYAFDEANNETYGHNYMIWLGIDTNLRNNTYTFTDENVTAINTVGLPDNRSQNKLNSVLALNFNASTERKKYLGYFQIGFRFKTGSFLDNSLINGTPKITESVDGIFNIRDENNVLLGNFSSVKDDFQTGDFHLYTAHLFGKNKNIGFNISLEHEFLSKRPENTAYSSNFTALIGPLIKTSAGTTFGIDAGWDNAIYNTKINDNFIARIRVGIPFNLLSKKEINNIE
ncbi:hypothetical protein [uncultured Dokdonia sp.]|uniref:hypothetical protein n=1 Tax=uncultured Dokdonia sp. TaxID=575653 RepID=UPI002633AF6F|nr:hypothetical protein [uncultured Dokdonia sp.]